MDERRVPVYVPVWGNANRVRPWDGSAKAQAWANLVGFRDRALPESAARVLAAGEGDDTDVLGLVSFLWGIDESEVAKILRPRMGSVSERVAELGAWRRNRRHGPEQSELQALGPAWWRSVARPTFYDYAIISRDP